MKLPFCTAVIMALVNVAHSVVTDNERPPCSLALSIPLNDFEEFENGSLYSEGILYPRELVWVNGTNTFACPCGRAGVQCVRTCCKPGELLNDTNCTMPQDSHIVQIKLPHKNLAKEIKHIDKLEDAFYVISNRICPNDARYLLQPGEYPEDEFVLHSNGSLTTQSTIYNQEQYCIGSSVIDMQLKVAICFEVMDEPQIPAPIMYHIGMIASIPFLLATAIVYAIIPELRNLYGKTLMCYVVCLFIAYTLLPINQFDQWGLIPLTVCILIGKIYTVFYLLFILLVLFYFVLGSRLIIFNHSSSP